MGNIAELLLGLALLGQEEPAAAQPGSGETITITRTPGGLHSCWDPDYEMTVRASGSVTVRSRADERCGKEHVTRYRLSAASFDQFRSLLLPLRPEAHWVALCRGRPLPDDVVVIIRRGIEDVTVTWDSGGFQRVFNVCIDDEDREALEEIGRAMVAIRQSLEGPPAPGRAVTRSPAPSSPNPPGTP